MLGYSLEVPHQSTSNDYPQHIPLWRTWENNATLIIKYSWLLLSRTRLSRITAYLEVKICFLPKHKNLTTCKKYCGKGEKLLLRSNFSSFPQYFQYISNFKSPITHILHIYLLNVVIKLVFPQFCKSDMSKYGYLEVFQRVPWNSRYWESTVHALLINKFSAVHISVAHIFTSGIN